MVWDAQHISRWEESEGTWEPCPELGGCAASLAGTLRHRCLIAAPLSGFSSLGATTVESG